MAASYRARALANSALLAAVVAAGGCGMAPERRGATVMFASGADLQSINSLLTLHPLARQVQRYVLFTTLVAYDSSLAVAPRLARSWAWSADRTTLTLRLATDVTWHDGERTTARDAAWTLDAAREAATGYPRRSDLAGLVAVVAESDSVLRLDFHEPQHGIPDVLTDLAVMPRHLLDTVPVHRLRESAFSRAPVGNGPFRFASYEPNRMWVFERNPTFSPTLGGPPALDRFVVVVVDEPATKLAALTSGELDFAGIQPAHAAFVARDPRLAVMTYPLMFTYGVVLNTRRAPFNDLRVRQRLAASVDRQEIVDGFVFGFGTEARGPAPPDVLPASAFPPAPRATDATADSIVAFELLTVGSGEAALEQLLQAQLARSNLRVTIRQLELSAFLDRVYGPARDFDAAVLGIQGDLALGHVATLLEVTGMPDPGGTSGRLALLAAEQPVTFLYHARGVQGVNRRVRNVRMDLRGELPTVAEWSVE